MKWSEDKLQGECFKWFWNAYPRFRRLLFAVPNGGRRDIITASQLKATGTVAGIPDLVLCFRRQTWFFELKTASGKTSPDQDKVHSILKSQGFIVWIIRDFDSFQRIVEGIIFNDDLAINSKLKTMNMIKQEEFVYRHQIFQFLWNDLPLGYDNRVLVDDLATPETKEKFVHYVKTFVRGNFDSENGIQILFTDDYSAIYKLKSKLTGNG
jgi:hypothetical protein